MADLHIVPDGDGWKVTHDGVTISTHKDQEEAIKAGREEAKKSGCEVVIHGKDGRIREKDSEGNDPRDIPG